LSGADANARQQKGYTPLMGAASAGSVPIVELLLRAGADKTLQSEDGQTARDVALARGHPEQLVQLVSP